MKESIRNFEKIDLAISYIQFSGWEILKPLIRGKENRVRVLCTDQLGITDPKAVIAMQRAGVSIRAYDGSNVFHPKVVIVRNNGSDCVLVGSANLSRSALVSGVEAISLIDDKEGKARDWFERLFSDRSVEFSTEILEKMETLYTARVKSNLVFARTQKEATASTDVAVATETIEAAFASLPSLVVPLNADKAANNVRTLKRIQAILDQPRLLEGKALSEFKLIGFAANGQLTPLGMQARGQQKETIARLWMQWLKQASTAEISSTSPSGMLEQTRIAFATFWRLPKVVREFYLTNCTAPAAEIRPLLQVIELLANTGRDYPSLRLKDLETLASMLDATGGLPAKTRAIVGDYLANKGTRGWREPDREIVLRAWAAV
nr:phospholipase D-like domain-containing protein [Qipengyuania vesicularis]